MKVNLSKFELFNCLRTCEKEKFTSKQNILRKMIFFWIWQMLLSDCGFSRSLSEFSWFDKMIKILNIDYAR